MIEAHLTNMRIGRIFRSLRSAPRYSILTSTPYYYPRSQTQHSSLPRFYSSRTNPTFTSTHSHNQHTTKNDDHTVQPNLHYDESSGWEEEAENGTETETELWEEVEENVEPMIGDGGDGGGIVLQDVPWGERALSIAKEVLLQFGDDFEIFAFKTSPRGYIYVRIDKLPNEYGCPSMEEIESYSREYKKRLDEDGAAGRIPDDLALEVSSPGADRLLKVPDDLCRFKDMPMMVCYLDNVESNGCEKDGVFFSDSVEMELGNCVWKLADVKENRDPESKGRPLSRKRRDWRLKLPFEAHKRVTLYVRLS